MKHISLDIETYSSVDLSKSSVYRYSEAPDFEILLFGYSLDDAPVQVIDLVSGERLRMSALPSGRLTPTLSGCACPGIWVCQATSSSTRHSGAAP